MENNKKDIEYMAAALRYQAISTRTLTGYVELIVAPSYTLERVVEKLMVFILSNYINDHQQSYNDTKGKMQPNFKIKNEKDDMGNNKIFLYARMIASQKMELIETFSIEILKTRDLKNKTYY